MPANGSVILGNLTSQHGNILRAEYVPTPLGAYLTSQMEFMEHLPKLTCLPEFKSVQILIVLGTGNS